MTKPFLAGKGKNTNNVNDMKKSKKYVMPEVQVMKIDMAPLLAGSGDVIKSDNNEGGNWSTGAVTGN